MKTFILIAVFFSAPLIAGPVKLGIDCLFEEGTSAQLKGKRVGLITNHTGINRDLHSTIEVFKERGKDFQLVALFAPEHGINGVAYAAEKVEHSHDQRALVIYSLHGDSRRPTEKMLKGIDLLIFDVQEIGCRSYTYASTLFYVMEEAAKKNIPVMVLDRPNPMGGEIVDGPMLTEKWRSFLGYVNVPYCHGMTIGELAKFFNEEYQIGCKLTVIPMQGWKRSMSFKDTGLQWIPTSPYIPEPDTPYFYASTGILGALGIVNIGIGYTLPFKVIGAPWIHAHKFAKELNEQRLAGVKFMPFYYRPFYGKYKNEDCQGVKILITDPRRYRPLAVQYLMIGILKSLYPKQFEKALAQVGEVEKKSFCQVSGNDEMLQILTKEKYVAWKLILFQEEERKAFLEKRKKYLLYH